MEAEVASSHERMHMAHKNERALKAYRLMRKEIDKALAVMSEDRATYVTIMLAGAEFQHILERGTMNIDTIPEADRQMLYGMLGARVTQDLIREQEAAAKQFGNIDTKEAQA